jgi:hypothetical protein
LKLYPIYGVQFNAMNDPERDQLWHLLGKAKLEEPSPFFAAKVVASVRKLKADRRMFWTNWLRFGLPGAVAGALAVSLTVFNVRVEHKIATKPTAIVTQSEPSELELIADLDSALSSEESSVWLDSSSH